MSSEMRDALVQQVAQRFEETGFRPDFGPAGAKLLVRLYHRLATTGEPIPATDALAIAAECGMEPDAAQKMLRGPVERDGELIRGVVGLSLNEFSHSFTVGAHHLYTWCALDPLFIAPAVGGDASIESRDPHNDQLVSMEIRGGVVESFSPPEAVVSVVVPTGDDAFGSAQRVWMMFCDHVGFFSSQQSAEAHFAGRGMEVYFLSIPEAYELSRITFANLHSAA